MLGLHGEKRWVVWTHSLQVQPEGERVLQLHLRASIGVVVGALAADGGESLLASADARLYQAKHRGRGQIVANAGDGTPGPDRRG